LYAGCGAAVSPRSSAHCSCQPRSSIFGSRWITTFRKLPTHSPTTSAHAVATAGSVKRRRHRKGASRATSPAAASESAAESGRTHEGPDARSDDRAELEDRQVHRDDQAADDDAEEHDDDRLEQARQRATASSTSRS
jgi:hypothetical protein